MWSVKCGVWSVECGELPSLAFLSRFSLRVSYLGEAYGLGSGVHSRFKVWGLASRVQGPGSRVKGLDFRSEGLGLRV